MRILITGGAGFLGSHLVDRFLSEGHEIIVLDNLITGNLENIAHNLGNEHFQFIKHDVTNHIHLPGTLDVVMHLASPPSPIDFERIPIRILKANSLGTHNALGLALNKGARFFLASTSEVYGDPLVHPQPETYWGNVNPIGIRSVYDEAKRFAEAITMAYHRIHHLDTRIVRIFNTYGPRMRKDDGRVIPNFIRQALNQEPLTLYGDGTQTRSFTYVDDEIEGFYRLLMSDEVMPVNIGNTNETNMIELAETINNLTGNQAGVTFLPLPHKDDPKRRKPDITRARTILGWEPTTTLEEGLARTIAWFRQQTLSIV